MSKLKVSLAEPDIDSRFLDERGPSKERLTKTAWELGDSGVITIRQSPIERAVKRGTFTARQGLAAEKFRVHWTYAQLMGTVGSANLLRVFGTGNDFAPLWRTERAETHHAIYEQARKKVRTLLDAAGSRGDHGVRLLELIVCREVAFQPAGEAIGFGAKDADIMARTLMRSALNILIDQWGL